METSTSPSKINGDGGFIAFCGHVFGFSLKKLEVILDRFDAYTGTHSGHTFSQLISDCTGPDFFTQIYGSPDKLVSVFEVVQDVLLAIEMGTADKKFHLELLLPEIEKETRVEEAVLAKGKFDVDTLTFQIEDCNFDEPLKELQNLRSFCSRTSRYTKRAFLKGYTPEVFDQFNLLISEEEKLSEIITKMMGVRNMRIEQKMESLRIFTAEETVRSNHFGQKKQEIQSKIETAEKRNTEIRGRLLKISEGSPQKVKRNTHKTRGILFEAAPRN